MSKLSQAVSIHPYFKRRCHRESSHPIWTSYLGNPRSSWRTIPTQRTTRWSTGEILWTHGWG